MVISPKLTSVTRVPQLQLLNLNMNLLKREKKKIIASHLDLLTPPQADFSSCVIEDPIHIFSRAKLLLKGYVKYRLQAEESSDALFGFLFLIILHHSVQ